MLLSIASHFQTRSVLAHRQQLAGTDVIIVHRLLKNSVQSAQCLLLTEAAWLELQFPETMIFKSSSETYEDFGRIKTEFHDFNFDGAPVPAVLIVFHALKTAR